LTFPQALIFFFFKKKNHFKIYLLVKSTKANIQKNGEKIGLSSTAFRSWTRKKSFTEA
jgi:hypothetical protein